MLQISNYSHKIVKSWHVVLIAIVLMGIAFIGISSTNSSVAYAQSSAAANNTITYTFNSVNEPWTPLELATLQQWVATDYPVMVQVFGEPSVTRTINVSKNSNLATAGVYTGPEIVLSRLDESIFIHESLHAFRTGYNIQQDTWEEGMVRAGEIEVLYRLDPSNEAGKHSYYYDVAYENYNQQPIGITSGQYWKGAAGMNLLRYQMSGYAWGKILIENPQFLVNFNAALYATPFRAFSQAELVNWAKALQPTVEGLAPIKTTA